MGILVIVNVANLALVGRGAAVVGVVAFSPLGDLPLDVHAALSVSASLLLEAPESSVAHNLLEPRCAPRLRPRASDGGARRVRP